MLLQVLCVQLVVAGSAGADRQAPLVFVGEQSLGGVQ